MKRAFSITFLAVFLLNVFGYYGIFMGLRNQMAGQMRENLNESNYALSDEITFKVPIAIPYASDMTEFQRVDGEFEHDGSTYRLVKQKLFKDTLYIVCVKDTHIQKIDKALEDYVKTFSDKPSSEKGGSKTLLTFSKDFISEGISVESNHAGWELLYSQLPSQSDKTIQFYPDIVQPPKI
jgi:hypothetical protein